MELQKSVVQKKNKLKDILRQPIPDWAELAHEAETIFIVELLEQAGLEEVELPALTSAVSFLNYLNSLLESSSQTERTLD